MQRFKSIIQILALLLGAASCLAQNPSAFTVNTSSREDVREFYNAVYSASDNIPMNSSADPNMCLAGTNSTAFLTATLRRINWFRAMGGVPAVEFSAAGCAADQSSALMASVNEQLLHEDIPPTWSCFDPDGTNASDHSNLFFGMTGPDAITAYLWEAGATNQQVGHRRWILYPQTQTMATGDVPFDNGLPACNATWVVDTNFDGPRPATTWPFVSWPSQGYAPFPVVYPRWSFALSNADFTNVNISMLSNGVPINVTVEQNQPGYGENGVAWHPSSLDPIETTTVFPFDGADTIYDIMISNIMTTNGPIEFSYSVTVFDPAPPGPDTVPLVANGPSHPSVNENNLFTCPPSQNPNTTSYQWVTAQPTNANMIDSATKGLTNFAIFPAPLYPIITNSTPVGGKCFHLTHTNPTPQLLEFKYVLFPTKYSQLRFSSYLGYATSNETARAQISTNGGGIWTDLLAQAGTNGLSQKEFVTEEYWLGGCAGEPTLLRFNYDYRGGSYYGEIQPDVGWQIKNVVLTNINRLMDLTTNSAPETNFDFIPPRAGEWILQAQNVLFNQFAVGGSPAQQLIAVTNPAPTMVQFSAPVVVGGEAELPFVVFQGGPAKFQLLESSQIDGPWSINPNAVLSVAVPHGSIPGSFYQFTVPTGGSAMFYRVRILP